MHMNLTPNEIRVISCLIEKEITTPDQYPLSLNALVNACNQKSNRDPVTDLSEAATQETVDGLLKKFLVSRAPGHGGRVTKYQHRFCNTEFGELKLSAQGVAVLCELMLRGAQTPGELRARAERLARFADAAEVEAELDKLAGREPPLVVKLPREPGRREARYAHLFSGEPVVAAAAPNREAREAKASDRERIEVLEQEVRSLRAEMDELRRAVGLLAD
ncbi:MAG: YceH family protein [Candidatus Methylumidiphilus sp.]